MRRQLICWTPKAFMTKSYLWGRPPLEELTLELYFSALYVDEEPEWPLVVRGERPLEEREENLRSRSKSDKAERAPSPELKVRSESIWREKSFSKVRSNSRSRVERAPSPAERLA